MKVLIMFNSAFQMIAGIQTVMKYFEGAHIDVLITDRLSDASDLRKKFENTGYFDHVYMMKAKNRVWRNWQHTWLGFFYDREIKKSFEHIDDGYDVFLFANISGVSTCIATYLHRKFRTNLYMFEDGFASYSDLYKRMLDCAYSNSNFSSCLFYGMEKRAIFYVSRYYVFNPELLQEWRYKFEIIPIPKIDSTSETKEFLNEIFDYRNLKDNYQRKLVFFEESYVEDGIDVGDFDLISEISGFIGKENIIIKIHPRNKVNRFKKAGFTTNEDTSVPWEIIALNQDFSGTILMTISSGSSITSYFMSKERAKSSILLYDMEGIDKTRLTPSIKVFDKICKNDAYFVFPRSMSEVREILKEE